MQIRYCLLKVPLADKKIVFNFTWLSVTVDNNRKLLTALNIKLCLIKR